MEWGWQVRHTKSHSHACLPARNPACTHREKGRTRCIPRCHTRACTSTGGIGLPNRRHAPKHHLGRHGEGGGGGKGPPSLGSLVQVLEGRHRWEGQGGGQMSSHRQGGEGTEVVKYTAASPMVRPQVDTEWRIVCIFQTSHPWLRIPFHSWMCGV
jgi:hypothetical protein